MDSTRTLRDAERAAIHDRWNRRAPHIFLAISLTFGMTFAILTPPFQVPDEPVHFFRAFVIAEGELASNVAQDPSALHIPRSLASLATAFTADITGDPARRIPPGRILEALKTPLSTEERFTVYQVSSVSYPPFGYLPQALGVAFVRIFSDSALALLYGARTVNVLTTSLLIWVGIQRAGCNRWGFMLLALTPMALFMRASASPDAFTMAVALLFVGVVVRLTTSEQPVHSSDIWLVMATAFFLPLTKLVYAPLALAVVAVPRERFANGRRAASFRAAVTLATSAGIAMAIYWARNAISAGRKAGVDPAAQIGLALADPLRVIGTIFTDYVVHAPRYLAHLVGRLGWLDTPLPTFLLATYIVALILVAIVDGCERSSWTLFQRTIFAITAAAALALIGAALYAGWTPVGADYVEGIQGRYLLPIAPLLLITLNRRRTNFPIGPAATAFSVVALLITVWVILQRYYA